MDRDYIDMHQIVDRYVMDKLSDDERSEFEIALLDNPDLQDQVEMARAMQTELRSSGARLQSVGQRSRGLRAVLANPVFGAVAASVCAASLLLTATMYVRLNSTGYGGAPEVITVSEIWIEQTRGELRTFESNLTEGPLLLHVDVGPQPTDTYRIQIVPATGKPLPPLSVIRNADFTVTALLRNPQAGRYTVAIDAVTEAGPVRVGEHVLILKRTQ